MNRQERRKQERLAKKANYVNEQFNVLSDKTVKCYYLGEDVEYFELQSKFDYVARQMFKQNLSGIAISFEHEGEEICMSLVDFGTNFINTEINSAINNDCKYKNVFLAMLCNSVDKAKVEYKKYIENSLDKTQMVQLPANYIKSNNANDAHMKLVDCVVKNNLPFLYLKEKVA
jgi:hypothetical protein